MSDSKKKEAKTHVDASTNTDDSKKVATLSQPTQTATPNYRDASTQTNEGWNMRTEELRQRFMRYADEVRAHFGPQMEALDQENQQLTASLAQLWRDFNANTRQLVEAERELWEIKERYGLNQPDNNINQPQPGADGE